MTSNKHDKRNQLLKLYLFEIIITHFLLIVTHRKLYNSKIKNSLVRWQRKYLRKMFLKTIGLSISTIHQPLINTETLNNQSKPRTVHLSIAEIELRVCLTTCPRRQSCCRRLTIGSIEFKHNKTAMTTKTKQIYIFIDIAN